MADFSTSSIASLILLAACEPNCHRWSVRFTLATLGSRGEGDPLIALGLQLQHRGHEVLFVAMEEHQSQACAFGIRIHPVQGNLKASLQSPENRDVWSSMIGPHPERSTELVAEAIRRIPQRVLVCGGWGGLRNVNLPENSLFIESAPFRWLFPYVSLVAHHGGAGIVGTTLKAGKPAVICPVGADHPFWAAVAHQRGVAPPFLMHHKLTTEWLVNSIRVASSTPSMARAAEELGRKLREEDSFGKAIQFIERKIEAWRK